jgi:hypothetical protein
MRCASSNLWSEVIITRPPRLSWESV